MYRKGSGIVPGMVNIYGSKQKFLYMQQMQQNNSGMHVWYDIRRSEMKSLDQESRRCDASDVKTSVSKCIGSFIEDKMDKCSLHLLMNDPLLETCDHQTLGEPSKNEQRKIIS